MSALAAPAWLPLLVVGMLFFVWAPPRGRLSPRWRAALAACTLLLVARYAWWRTTIMAGANPAGAEQLWQWVFYAAEMALLVDGAIFVLLMARTRDRRQEADAHQQWVDGMIASGQEAALPTVDVFIPTYNEEWDVLSATVTGALALDYPHVAVHVLDDGGRDWLAERCAELGVLYHRRPDRSHAKAGNINHTFARTSGDLVLVFDADFVAQRNFLRRTVGFFRAPDVAVVQVPHHFFNTDPTQNNLRIFGEHADDQAFFFTDIMAARDAWGVAFSCGSNSLIRRTALAALGGIPTASITEDILTSLALLQRGWRTVYLNERLARGLAPEGLSALYTQRARWARGGIQLLFLREGPLRAPGLTFVQRLFFLPLSWIAGNLCLPVMIAGPICFLWLGLVAVPASTGEELIAYQAPMLAAMLFITRKLSQVERSVLLSLAQSVFTTFRLAPAVLHSLVRPFAVGFKVTPKGKLANGMDVDVRAALLSGGTLVLMLAGMLLNGLPDFERLPPNAFLTPSLLWGTVTVVVMIICLLMAFEHRPPRAQERFVVNEEHHVLQAGTRHAVRVVDLSLTGAALQWGTDRPAVGEPLALQLRDVGVIDAVVRRHIGEVGLAIAFAELDVLSTRILTAKLFAHDYDTHAVHASAQAGMRRFLQRLLGAAATTAPTTAPAWSLGAIPPSSPPRGARPDLDAPPARAYPRLFRPIRRDATAAA